MSLNGKAESVIKLRGSLSMPDAIVGKSAYEIAVMNGFGGTEEEWLASLVGSKIVSTEYVGMDADGGNIYKQTFDNGHTNVFIAPKGEQGEQGEKGDTGASGKDGVSPTVKTTETSTGYRVDITDANGTQTMNLRHGKDGAGGGGGGWTITEYPTEYGSEMPDVEVPYDAKMVAVMVKINNNETLGEYQLAWIYPGQPGFDATLETKWLTPYVGAAIRFSGLGPFDVQVGFYDGSDYTWSNGYQMYSVNSISVKVYT